MMTSFFKINKSRGLGFTLIELMIVVTIIPEIITPSTTDKNAFFFGILKSQAAKLPV